MPDLQRMAKLWQMREEMIETLEIAYSCMESEGGVIPQIQPLLDRLKALEEG